MNIITKILSLEVTELCNLSCKHCLDGKSCNVVMSDEVIEGIFREVCIVDELLLTGGEVFLAYDRVKRVLELARKYDVKISRCSIITNGCIYDERIYRLLDEYFHDDYSIYISSDDFHEKSISRIYNGDGVSNNPSLYPKSMDDVNNNMLRHVLNAHFKGFKELGDKLINVGRAKNIDAPKFDFEVIGYFYDFFKDFLMVGPVIFISAGGYITEGNDEIEHYRDGSIGNVLNDSISNSIIRGGLHMQYNDPKDFWLFLTRREDDYRHLKGKHYILEDGHMKEIEINIDESYKEEMKRFMEFMKSCKSGDDMLKKILTYDFSKYPYDLSLIDHMES